MRDYSPLFNRKLTFRGVISRASEASTSIRMAASLKSFRCIYFLRIGPDHMITPPLGPNYLQGDLTFEKDAVFTNNLNDREEYGSGPGGAISNHVKGTMTFMGSLNMNGNTADVSNRIMRQTI